MASTSPVPGDRISDFALRTVDQSPYEWKAGRPTVLTFCAFWCDTWKTQVRRLESARRDLGPSPVDFLTISIDGRWTELAKPAEWTLLTDPGGQWCSTIGIDRIPYTLVLDKDGVVRWASFGVVRSEMVVRQVQRAMKPPPNGVVYLGFDDFPSPSGDDLLLDALRREGVSATFFCVGRNLAGREEAVRRALREGHALQVHSWNHDAAVPELDKCLEALAKLGAEPTIYRPPGSSKLIRIAGQELPYPSVNPADYARPGPDELTRRVLLAVRPKSVILLHAGVADTVEALPEMIRGIRARGFGFGILR